MKNWLLPMVPPLCQKVHNKYVTVNCLVIIIALGIKYLKDVLTSLLSIVLAKTVPDQTSIPAAIRYFLL